MAYFDSSKNRALWEIRLGELRRERAAREAGGGEGLQRDQPVKQVQNPSRVRVTYQQLLKEEAMASEKTSRRGPKAMARAKEGPKLDERAKEARSHEMG